MGNEIEEKLRDTVQTLLSKKEIEYLIGYECGSDLLHTTPCFIKNSTEVDRLVWNPFCNYNLVKYLLNLKELPGKNGIILKGCDARAIVELLKHNQIEREKIFVVGVECKGQADPEKVKQIMGDGIERIEDLGDKFLITIGNTGRKRQKTIEKEKVLRERCFTCKHPVDFEYDIILGEMTVLPFVREDTFTEVKELEDLSIEEKREYWDAQFSQCIRCYACRNVCYACFCSECMFDKSMPRWISKANRLTENWTYHLIRAFHIAGRCIDCGECERVCPVGIPLRKLNRKLAKDLQELFGYEGAGIRIEEPPPLVSFDLGDLDPFI